MISAKVAGEPKAKVEECYAINLRPGTILSVPGGINTIKGEKL